VVKGGAIQLTRYGWLVARYRWGSELPSCGERSQTRAHLPAWEVSCGACTGLWGMHGAVQLLQVQYKLITTSSTQPGLHHSHFWCLAVCKEWREKAWEVGHVCDVEMSGRQRVDAWAAYLITITLSPASWMLSITLILWSSSKIKIRFYLQKINVIACIPFDAVIVWSSQKIGCKMANGHWATIHLLGRSSHHHGYEPCWTTYNALPLHNSSPTTGTLWFGSTSTQ